MADTNMILQILNLVGNVIVFLIIVIFVWIMLFGGGVKISLRNPFKNTKRSFTIQNSDFYDEKF